MAGRLAGIAQGWAVLGLVACAAPNEPPAAEPSPVVIETVAERAGSPAAMSPEPVVVAEVPADPIAGVGSEAVAEPTPEPVPFEGLEVVRLDQLVAELDRVADELAEVPAVRADYADFLAAHGLADSDALYRDYVRVKLVFESARDGGLWHLRWDITNEKPNSEQIWRQWKRARVPQADAAFGAAGDEPEGPPTRVAMPTAFAECDELSALFAFLVYRMGVRHVGLYWPTWNHVVAVWTVRAEDGKAVRVVVPTSQIFLTNDDSLGTKGFDPWSQKTIYEYRRRDVKGSHAVDGELARFFVVQARRYGGLPQLELQRLRNERDDAMGAAIAERRRDAR